MNKESQIINPALEKLGQLTPMQGRWDDVEEVLEIRNASGDILQRYPVVVVRTLTQAGLAGLKEVRDKRGKLLLIAGKLLPGVRARLRELAIAYLDSAGNACMQDGHMAVFVDGQNDYPALHKEKRQLFTRTSIRIIFQLLIAEEGGGYRELSEALGVSLGSVGQTMKRLQKEGYLLKTGKAAWRLHRKKELLERWIPAYADQLRPSLLLGQYRFASPADRENWQDAALPDDAQWGGEPAAWLMTRYMQPAEWTIYTSGRPAELMKSLRLLPDRGGPVAVYQKFWAPSASEEPSAAPLLLVYCDLMASGVGRNLEIAKKIWDEAIADQF